MDYRELAEAVGPRTGATQEWVFRVLREGIISGKLKGGTQLKQDEVSAALTVSHIPVREALRQLEAQGLVTIHPNRGSTVTQLTRSTLEDMMEIRSSISSQLLTVFALPLLFAGVHLVFAFPMIRRMLTLFSLYNVGLFVRTTAVSFVAFAVFYAVIYRLTSGVYYRIVSGAEAR